jgi:FAD/FMN-containing dehydrogenase
MTSNIYHPTGPEEVQNIFREARKAREGDRGVRVGIVESPYRPSRTAGDSSFLLSCVRMNKIAEVSSGDMLAVVEGGVTYGEFARAVHDAGLYFPHVPRTDVAMAEMVMDGTLFSTEGSFGSLRESILAVELVTPEAETVRFGSRAIKDVGGYEIAAFLLGQGGRCGMITSVTFRLLARPCCRAFVAGRGDGRSLKTLSHNLRKEFRPASIEIFEGEAAGIVLQAFSEAPSEAGAGLSHLMEGSGDALLVGELQGLEPAVEDQLQLLVDSNESEHAAFILADEELFGIARRYPLAAAARGEGTVVQVCYDGPSGPEIPAGSLLYRSLYPERIEVYVPTAHAADIPLETIRSDPGIRRFVAGAVGTGRREQVYVIMKGEGGAERVRISAGDLLDLAEADGPVDGERAEQLRQARMFEELNSKVLRAFDPDRMMLP